MKQAIISHNSARLDERLLELLGSGATSARFVVGYLFFEGLLPLREELARLPEIYLLIGNVENRLTAEQIQEETVSRTRGGEEWVRDQEDLASSLRTVHDRCAVETALNVRRTLARLEQTEEMRQLLIVLARRIASGIIKVRVYRDSRLHTKLALVEYAAGNIDAPGVAIAGASNITLGGTPHPTELNVVIRDPDAIAELKSWFTDLWGLSQDFQRELFEELGGSWACTEVVKTGEDVA